jgi:hypothetical protein
LKILFWRIDAVLGSIHIITQVTTLQTKKLKTLCKIFVQEIKMTGDAVNQQQAQ